jgi:DNA-binding response OmpR family regulator
VKILIIEDDPLVSEILTEYLDDAGYAYDTANNGREGVEKLQAGDDYNVILLDRMMPEMNGIAFMEYIRSHAEYNHIPVIMQTAAGSVSEIIEGSRSGVHYYITKPYSEELLLSIVKAAASETLSNAEVHV